MLMRSSCDFCDPPFQLTNYLTYFHEICYERFAIGVPSQRVVLLIPHIMADVRSYEARRPLNLEF
jgi:hypothetical protein